MKLPRILQTSENVFLKILDTLNSVTDTYVTMVWALWFIGFIIPQICLSHFPYSHKNVKNTRKCILISREFNKTRKNSFGLKGVNETSTLTQHKILSKVPGVY